MRRALVDRAAVRPEIEAIAVRQAVENEHRRLTRLEAHRRLIARNVVAPVGQQRGHETAAQMARPARDNRALIRHYPQ